MVAGATTMNTPPQRDTLAPRQPKGLGLGLVLALLVHGLLVLALALSVRWRASEPEGVQAELWSAIPQSAAPQAVTPPPAPPPAANPRPPKREPAKAKREPANANPEPAPLPDPKIAIEQAKKESAKEGAKEAAKAAKLAKREEAQLEDARRKDAERTLALDKKRELEAQDRKKRELVEQQQLAEESQLAAQREANLRRMLGQANAPTAATPGGTAAQDSGPSAGYAGRIKAAIKPNIVYADASSDSNPLATVEVRAAPDGTILGSKLIKSSGVKRWDEAVLGAVNKTEKMPRDTDGRVPPVFELNFRPND